MQTTSPTTRAFGICFLAMATLLSFLPLLPARAALPAWPDLSLYGGSYQDSILTSRKSRYIHNTNSSSTELTYEGKIVFTDDEKDIRSISPGGYFKFSKTTFGNRRAIHIESRSDGTLKRTYYVGRQEAPYEPEGRKWFADMLPEIIATSGIGAEDRVARIYQKSGTAGVLQEIGRIEGDHGKNTYFSYLVAQPGLKENDLRAIVTSVRTSVSSDYEKGKLLQKMNGRYLQNEGLAKDYLLTVGSISSDYEKAKMLRQVLHTENLPAGTYTYVLQTAHGISSDYEKGKLLSSLLVRPDLSSQNFRQALTVCTQISSDYELGKALTTAASHNPKLVAANYPEMLKAVGNISSDYEKSKALLSLLSHFKMAEGHYVPFIQTASSLSSDYEKAKVLQKLGPSLPRQNAQVMEAYKKAAKTINSDYERNKVAAILLN